MEEFDLLPPDPGDDCKNDRFTILVEGDQVQNQGESENGNTARSLCGARPGTQGDMTQNMISLVTITDNNTLLCSHCPCSETWAHLHHYEVSQSRRPGEQQQDAVEAECDAGAVLGHHRQKTW